MLDNVFVVQDLVKRLRELNPIPIPRRRWLLTAKNRQANRLNVKEWSAKNPEKRRLYREKYEASENGREKKSIRRHKRRVLQLGCVGGHSIQEWQNKKALYGNRCVYCHRKLNRLTKDHIVPLSKGGTNYIYNIVPACRKCNSSKGDAEIQSWQKFVGLQLPLSFN